MQKASRHLQRQAQFLTIFFAVRTAYRAACLRTHPDKAKPEDKKTAEYEFRRVSADMLSLARQVARALAI